MERPSDFFQRSNGEKPKLNHTALFFRQSRNATPEPFRAVVLGGGFLWGDFQSMQCPQRLLAGFAAQAEKRAHSGISKGFLVPMQQDGVEPGR